MVNYSEQNSYSGLKILYQRGQYMNSEWHLPIQKIVEIIMKCATSTTYFNLILHYLRSYALPPAMNSTLYFSAISAYLRLLIC